MADIEIKDLPIEELGPKMLACTPIERRFVQACVTIGAGHWARAAGLAGYKGSPEVLKVTGWRCSQRQRVREAMLECAAANLSAHALAAQATVIEIMTDDRADKKVRLSAAAMVMDRTGMHAKSEHNVNVTHELGDKASMIALLKSKVEANPEIINSLPEPVRKLLEAPKAAPAPVIDAEFTEVPDLSLEECLR